MNFKRYIYFFSALSEMKIPPLIKHYFVYFHLFRCPIGNLLKYNVSSLLLPPICERFKKDIKIYKETPLLINIRLAGDPIQ